MSINYSDALRPYANKGEVGMPENIDTDDEVERKCQELAVLLRESDKCLVITGAGVSTSAGIADFRGPNGVWTLEKEGKPAQSIDFSIARPTLTHHALRILEEKRIVKFLVTQNVDGLHPRSGFPMNRMAELHGNVFAEQCDKCKRRYYRTFPVGTIGLNYTGRDCDGTKGGRRCRGKLRDMTLDWEDELPEPDFTNATKWAKCADLTLCLGTSLQIVPVGDFPLDTLRNGGKVVTVNLQNTKQERKASIAIHAKVDRVIRRVLELLHLDIPDVEEAVLPEDVVEDSRHPLEKLKVPIRKRRSKAVSEDIPDEKLKKEEIKAEDSVVDVIVSQSTEIGDQMKSESDYQN